MRGVKGITERRLASGQKVYKAEVRLKGFKRISQTFDRRSQALRWKEDTEHALKNGFPLPGDDLPQDDLFLAEAVDRYLAIMEQDTGRSRHTILTDRGTGKRLQAAFGRHSMRSLEKEDIEEYKAARLRIVGPSSIRQDMSMLSRIYETARIEWKLKQLSYPGADVPLPSPPVNRKKVVPIIAFEQLLTECQASKNTMLHPLVYVLLNTGMRPEEAVLMRWHQVVIKENVIDLSETKTEPRRVPLSADCLQLLIKMKKGKRPQELVFISEERARKDKPVRFFRRAFEQACIRAGINQPLRRDVGAKRKQDLEEPTGAARVTLYTLRHTAATYLLMHGADIRTVADILGHKNITQTMKYTHMADSHKLAAVNLPGLPWQSKE